MYTIPLKLFTYLVFFIFINISSQSFAKQVIFNCPSHTKVFSNFVLSNFYSFDEIPEVLGLLAKKTEVKHTRTTPRLKNANMIDANHLLLSLECDYRLVDHEMTLLFHLRDMSYNSCEFDNGHNTHCIPDSTITCQVTCEDSQSESPSSTIIDEKPLHFLKSNDVTASDLSHIQTSKYIVDFPLNPIMSKPEQNNFINQFLQSEVQIHLKELENIFLDKGISITFSTKAYQGCIILAGSINNFEFLTCLVTDEKVQCTLNPNDNTEEINRYAYNVKNFQRVFTDINLDFLDIIEKFNDEGTKTLIKDMRKQNLKNTNDTFHSRAVTMYPNLLPVHYCLVSHGQFVEFPHSNLDKFILDVNKLTLKKLTDRNLLYLKIILNLDNVSIQFIASHKQKDGRPLVKVISFSNSTHFDFLGYTIIESAIGQMTKDTIKAENNRLLKSDNIKELKRIGHTLTKIPLPIDKFIYATQLGKVASTVTKSTKKKKTEVSRKNTKARTSARSKKMTKTASSSKSNSNSLKPLFFAATSLREVKTSGGNELSDTSSTSSTQSLE